jgi:hypothetical protein
MPVVECCPLQVHLYFFGRTGPDRKGLAGGSTSRSPVAARSWSPARIRLTIARLPTERVSGMREPRPRPRFPRCPVGLIETSAALGACLLVLAVAVVLDRRPYRPGRRNYVPIMIIAVDVIGLVAAVLAGPECLIPSPHGSCGRMSGVSSSKGWEPSAVSSISLTGWIRYPASAKAATMRAARASGSPRAVSLIVFAMIRSMAAISIPGGGANGPEIPRVRSSRRHAHRSRDRQGPLTLISISSSVGLLRGCRALYHVPRTHSRPFRMQTDTV